MLSGNQVLILEDRLLPVVGDEVGDHRIPRELHGMNLNEVLEDVKRDTSISSCNVAALWQSICISIRGMVVRICKSVLKYIRGSDFPLMKYVSDQPEATDKQPNAWNAGEPAPNQSAAACRHRCPFSVSPLIDICLSSKLRHAVRTYTS
jgi:hypothetical protein